MSDPNCAAHFHHRLAGLRAALSSDVRAFLAKSPENVMLGDSLHERISAFFSPDVFSVFLYRLAHFFHARGWRRFAGVVAWQNSLLHKCCITPQSCIGPAFRLPHPAGIVFHGRAGRGLRLYSLSVCMPAAGIGGPVENGPILGDHVSVGAHACLLGPISIPSDTTIAQKVRLDAGVPATGIVAGRTRCHIRPRAAPAEVGLP